MKQPSISNTAQEDQEAKSAADRARFRAETEKLGARLKSGRDGAVTGGEETKPGQMDGDEDISPNAPQSEIEQAATGEKPPR
jgi:hypothetical protein